jgi:hypothetical protein
MTRNFRTITLVCTLVILAFVGGLHFAGWLSGTDAITGDPVRSLNPYFILLGLINFAAFVAIVRSKDGLPWGGGPGSPSAWWMQR